MAKPGVSIKKGKQMTIIYLMVNIFLRKFVILKEDFNLRVHL
jgi:hypothetical protein